MMKSPDDVLLPSFAVVMIVVEKIYPSVLNFSKAAKDLGPDQTKNFGPICTACESLRSILNDERKTIFVVTEMQL